jgi:hypothetical protein
MKSDPVAEMQARIEKLEKLTTPKEELEARVASVRSKMEEFGYISRDEREKLAEKGQALPDGSYPIRNVEDLRNAIQAYGRSKESDRAKVRKHIEKRARQLNFPHLIPDEWAKKSHAVTASVDSLKARVLAAQEALGKTFATEDEVPVAEPATEAPVAEVPPTQDVVGNPEEGDFKYVPGKNQPRNWDGRFRDVLARLKQNLGESGNQGVVDQIKQTEDASTVGSYKESADAASNLLSLLDRLDDNALNATSVENVRAAAAELGKVITNLPLPFTNQAVKIRYSDLPPALKNLMDNMVSRVEEKLSKEDADKATESVKAFMSGNDLFSQADISSQMAKMLRLLT